MNLTGLGKNISVKVGGAERGVRHDTVIEMMEFMFWNIQMVLDNVANSTSRGQAIVPQRPPTPNGHPLRTGTAHPPLNTASSNTGSQANPFSGWTGHALWTVTPWMGTAQRNNTTSSGERELYGVLEVKPYNLLYCTKHITWQMHNQDQHANITLPLFFLNEQLYSYWQNCNTNTFAKNNSTK